MFWLIKAVSKHWNGFLFYSIMGNRQYYQTYTRLFVCIKLTIVATYDEL